MAHTILTQTLCDGARDTIIKATIQSDGSSGDLLYYPIYKASDYREQSTDNSLARVTYHFDGFSGILYWDGGIEPVTFTGTGLDDMTRNSIFSGAEDAQYIIEIDSAGTPDTFKWSDNGGSTYTTGVAITGSAQALSNGIEVTFAATTGHTLGDKWTFDAGANIPLITIEQDYSDDLNFNDRAGGIYNNAGALRTGNILLSTTGLEEIADRGFIVFYILQKSIKVIR